MDPAKKVFAATEGEHQPGRRPKRWWVLLACVAIAISCWWWQREPRYEGLSLSRWLDTYDAILTGHLTEPGFEETRAALFHFGKVGLSYYTARLAYETPAWQLSTLNYLDTAPTRLNKLQKKLSTLGHEYIDARNRRAVTAALAFELLGTNGAVAVPDLERIAMSYDYPPRTQRTMMALSYAGPAGQAALQRIALNGTSGPRAEATNALNPATRAWWTYRNQGLASVPNWSNNMFFRAQNQLNLRRQP